MSPITRALVSTVVLATGCHAPPAGPGGTPSTRPCVARPGPPLDVGVDLVADARLAQDRSRDALWSFRLCFGTRDAIRLFGPCDSPDPRGPVSPPVPPAVRSILVELAQCYADTVEAGTLSTEAVVFLVPSAGDVVGRAADAAPPQRPGPACCTAQAARALTGARRQSPETFGPAAVQISCTVQARPEGAPRDQREGR